MSSHRPAAALAALMLLAVPWVACPQSYVSDMKALSGQVTIGNANKTFTKQGADQLMPGMGSQSAAVSGYIVTSPDEMAGKGADQLSSCKLRNRATMTDREKVQCDAALAVAGVATQRSQYSTVPDESAAWTKEVNRTTRLRSKADPTLGGNVPSHSIRGGTCTETTEELAGGTTSETCSVAHQWTGQTCIETLTVEVASSYTVTRTGLVIGSGLTQTQAAELVVGNPGATAQLVAETQDKWTSNCLLMDSNQLCDKNGEACTAGPLTRVIDGQSVERPCWQRTKGYTCYSPGAATDTCAPLASRGCSQIATSCVVRRANGDCVDLGYSMSCPAGNVGTATKRQCVGDKLCFGAQCFDTSRKADQDFATAMTYLEAGREGAVYSHASGGQVRLFAGQMGSCTKPAGPGIGAKCCQSSGGAVTNHQALGDVAATNLVGATVVSTVLGNAKSIGTHYAYDFMFNNDFFSEKAWSAIASGGWNPDAAFTDLLQGPSLSMYGFTIGPASAFGGIIPGNVTLVMELFGPGSSYSLTFNPYVFAATVALSVYSQLTTCTMDEQMLAMRRGANLCQHFNTYCSIRLPWPLKICVQETEEWCCWNSKLAMSISTQAKPRNCNGFTAEEFANVDFSKIDLSSFTNEIQAKASQYSNVASPAVVQVLKNRAAAAPAGNVQNFGLNPTAR